MAGPFTVINKNSFSIDTAANPNDRTNINDGYLQVQATITQALQEKNPLLSQTTFPAVVLHTSDASADIPYSDLFVSSLRHVVNPQVKVYFRVPLLHSNLPLPRALEDENLISEINKLSKLDPEYHEKFLISCHPFFYMDMNDAISLCPKDIIEVKFDDDTWTSARFQKLIAKGPNNTVPLKLTVQNLIVDMFDDAAEAVFLGPENEISAEAKRVGTAIHGISKGDREPPDNKTPCEFLRFWKDRYAAKALKNTRGLPPSIGEAIKAASAKYGLDYNMMLTIAKIETPGFNPNALNEKTSAQGLYQILKKFMPRYGVTSANVFDPLTNASAAALILRQNIDVATARLGRAPEPWEVYVMHNQGPDSFYVEHVTCSLFGFDAGESELQRVVQLIINNNFIGSYQEGTPKTGKFFVFGRPFSIPMTIPEDKSLKPDLESLSKNL
tara:strand:- start:1817 stop:3142 length:1326 start_codon:yes stop_codon:yes gene_type:complete